ncbi:ScbA/BarX family gamma-butyrolactone biosynthesis protein [Streptomyces sp. NRRL S-350]|uniref:ScbA/BarX family gamma-butyrolactone biosynthesis protein n=1 Tax=Streptomyces sp. NRRL S-350 TaxID=1463902 RepID=UPI0004C0D7CD|nr:ScbA/BarX family gamma-butyrolactone biosynthesis protein [Streptomyces sp. NRRL S-350]
MTLLAFRTPASAVATAEDPGAAAGPALAVGPVPRLTSTVPKEYVHRACHAEVFLTGSEQLNETTFAVSAQWPRAHTFFSTPDGTRHDPIQAAETIRQAGLYLAHTRFGVPLDHKFMMWNLDYTTRPRHLLIGAAPTDLTIEAKLVAEPRRTRTTVDFTLSTVVRRGPHLAATGYARFTTVPTSTYQRLRKGRHGIDQAPSASPATEPLPPARVGRLRACDVVLTPADEPGSWHLTPDLRHPILFDHANDHIPGMVLLEAARQATNALTSPVTVTPGSAATTFHRYAELDAHTTITARHTPGEDPDALVTTVTGHQHGEPIFTTVLTGHPDHR